MLCAHQMWILFFAWIDFIQSQCKDANSRAGQCGYVFYELPIRMNLYEWPTPNPAPKPTRHWGLDKSY